MKYDNPWPPVQPKDEKRYDIELRDGTTVENVEFWAFGGGFKPSEKKKGISTAHRLPAFRGRIIFFVEQQRIATAAQQLKQNETD
jgi:hypothetical protein